MSNLPIIIGVDPSSRKLAAVVTQGPHIIKLDVKALPEKKPQETCTLAQQWIGDLVWEMKRYGHEVSSWGTVDKPNRVYVFIEHPVYLPKAGAGSLIPQAQVGGALLAACGIAHVPAELVFIQDWKKQVVGDGGASKAEVAAWAHHYWRSLYRGAAGDQDLIDAGAINRFGVKMVKRLDIIAPPVKRIRRLRRAAPTG